MCCRERMDAHERWCLVHFVAVVAVLVVVVLLLLLLLPMLVLVLVLVLVCGPGTQSRCAGAHVHVVVGRALCIEFKSMGRIVCTGSVLVVRCRRLDFVRGERGGGVCIWTRSSDRATRTKGADAACLGSMGPNLVAHLAPCAFC